MLRTINGSLALLSRRQKFAIGALGAATLVVNFLDISAILLLGLIGTLAVGGTPSALSTWLSPYDQNELIIILLGLAAVIFAAKTTAGIGLTRVRQAFLAKLEVHFARAITSHLLSGELAEFKNRSRAQIEWSVLRSTAVAFQSVLGQALQLFAETSLALLILGVFFYTDWISALAVLLYFAAVIGLFQLATRSRLSGTGTDYAEGSIGVGQAISDVVGAFREISVSNRIDYFVERIVRSRARVAHAQALQLTLQAFPRLIVELALIVGAIGFAAFQFSRTAGSPDLGLLSIFIVGSLRMMSAMLPLYRAFMQLRYDSPQALSSQRILREAVVAASTTQSREAEALQHPTTPSLAPEVDVTSLSFRYTDRGESKLAIDGISLNIAAGSTVAFIGPSGAGKSTLADHILGLHTPAAGAVKVDGLAPQDLRRQRPGFLNYVPQKPGLIAGSLRENIALGVDADKVDSSALADAVQLAQIGELVSKLPDGLDTDLGTQNDALSGGQVQRIGLARALYTKPGLLVLDEATSALDGETEAAITDGLRSIGPDLTLVVIAHRLTTVQHADVIFVVDDAKLVASGSLRELREKSPLVQKYISLMSLS